MSGLDATMIGIIIKIIIIARISLYLEQYLFLFYSNVSEPMERSDNRPTNQDAELEAAIAALEILKKWGMFLVYFWLCIAFYVTLFLLFR